MSVGVRTKHRWKGRKGSGGLFRINEIFRTKMFDNNLAEAIEICQLNLRAGSFSVELNIYLTWIPHCYLDIELHTK